MAKEKLKEIIEYEDYEADYIEEPEALSDKVVQDKKGQVKFKSVNHRKRAEANEVETDGEIATYANYALEYFGYRCALSGEKLVIFDNPVERKGNARVITNLSAEHIVALTTGGNDIIPNIVPTVLQYNIQKNGYYILDWWPKAKDINGNSIYSPEKLLKLVNYMLKSLQARKDLGIKKQPREYRKRLLTPNEIDEFLMQEEIAKELLSDTITATTELEDGKNILTQIPQQEGEIPSLAKQKAKETKITEAMFLTDALQVLGKEERISQEVIAKLQNMYKEVEGEIPFEIEIRRNILFVLEQMGIKDNKYTVANDLLVNSDLLKKLKKTQEIKIPEFVEKYLSKKIERLNEIFSEEDLRKIITYKPDVLYDLKSVKEEKEIIDLYKIYFNNEVDFEIINKTYLINVLRIKKWMKDNNTTRPPRKQNDNETVPEDEAILGVVLGNIKSGLIKPYKELKTEEEKEEYKKKHPELEDVMAMVEEIDRNNIPIKEEQIHYINILKIIKWMKDNNTTRPPRKHNKTVPEDEAILGGALASIRLNLIKPYKELETEEEKEEYKRQHPELEDVMAMVEEIDKNNIPIKYQQMLEIVKWMKDNNTTRPPRQEDRRYNTVLEVEGRLGNNYSIILNQLIKPYKELKTEEEKEEYKRQHPELEEVMAMVEEIDRNNIPIKEEQIHYINILKIKEWMNKQKYPTKPPRGQDKNKTVPENEAKLGNALRSIRQNLIKPYKELETEEEKEEYKREHPELEEVMAMVEEIDRNNIPIKEEQTNYINMLKIKKWMKDNNTTKPPRTTGEGVPKEEAKKGDALRTIRQNLIKQYQKLQSEEEKEEYKKKHPELEEVMAMVEEIDKNNPKNKKKIKDTVKQNKNNLSEAMQVGEELEAEILMAEKVAERSVSDGRGQ